MGGSSKKAKVHVTAYYLSQHLGVSKALDCVSGIWYREKQIWTGHIEENESIVLNQGHLFGGPKEEGGIGGTIDVMLGGPSQVASETFAAKLGRTSATCPGFRGVTTLLFRSAVAGLGFYWQHNNAYLGNVWVKGTRAPKGLLPEIALIPRIDSSGADGGGFGGLDVLNNPSAIIHRTALADAGAPRPHLTDAVDTYVGAISFGFRYTTDPEEEGNWVYNFIDTTGAEFKVNIRRDDTDFPVFDGYDYALELRWSVHEDSPGTNSAQNIIYFGIPNDLDTGDGACHHVQFSWDTGHTTAGARQYSAALDGVALVRVNGTTDGLTGSRKWHTQSFSWDDFFAWYGPDALGAGAELYVEIEDYIDFTDQANINKFWSADTGFADLGADGSTPTGSQPIIYLSVRNGSSDEFLVNRGYGGDFVVDDGPLAVREIFCGEPATCIDADANPAHIIYECLTDTDFGMGAPSTLIDVDSFEEAAQTLYDEGLGLSLIWTRQTEIENFIQEILDHIEAALTIDPETGLFTLILIRADYDESTLFELTEDNCVVTKFQRKAWGDTINEIVPIYTDPDTQEEVAAPPVHDQANITMQGGIVTSTRNYYGARSVGLARRLAARDLRTSAEPLASAEVEIDRSAYSLKTGRCVKLTYPEYGIDTFVMRVGVVDYGKPGDSKIKATLVEDVFAKPSNDFDEVDYDEWEDPDSPPSPIDYVRLFTMPYRLIELMTEAVASDGTYPEVLLGVLAAEDSVTNSYDLMLELPDSLGVPTYTNVGTKNLTGHGTLAAALDAEASSLVAEFSDVISAPPQVGGLVFIGDAAEDEVEICLIDDFTGSPGSWVLRRGVLDTVPRAWDAGTVVWFTSLEAVIADETVLSSGQTINAKLLSNTALGQLAEADAPVETETLTDRPYQPIRPADVKVNGIGFGEVNAIDVDPIPVTWANRNRLTEPTPFLAWDDATVSPEAGQTTTIIVKDLLGATLDTISGLSGTSHDVPASSFGAETAGIIEVWSERDGLMSLQAHSIAVVVSAGNSLELEDTGVVELEDTGVLELE